MLPYTEQIRIYEETILGVEPPQDESREAREFREAIAKSVKEMFDQGLTPDIPFDPDGEFEE